MRLINRRSRLVVLNACAGLAVEIFDAASSRLSGASMARQNSNACNIKAGVGRLTTAENGIDQGADTLVAQLK